MGEPRPFGLADLRGCATAVILIVALGVALGLAFYVATHLGPISEALDRVVNGLGR